MLMLNTAFNIIYFLEYNIRPLSGIQREADDRITDIRGTT